MKYIVALSRFLVDYKIIPYRFHWNLLNLPFVTNKHIEEAPYFFKNKEN